MPRPLPRPVRVARRALAGIGGLLLFILALELLKKGAAALGPFVTDVLHVNSPLSAVGFGWLFAYVVLSGSPVAAISLTFYAAGVLDALQAYAMIAGSRLGASFIVLLVGFIYVIRGKARGQSLEMGVLSLLTTYAVYIIAIPLGAVALSRGLFDGVRPQLPPLLFDLIDAAYGPLVSWIAATLPAPLLFVGGVLIILGAFNLFDRALPNLSGRTPIEDLERHVFRPTVMFAMGALITLLTLSVSVSLGILVPLSAKGIARRENVIPYIMGANITTFVDTLFATLLLDAPGAFAIVLIEMLAVALVSLVILVFFFERFETLMLSLAQRILATRIRLATFIVIILVIPLALLLM